MGFVLFDFDGTIAIREIVPAFVYSVVPPARPRIGKLRLAPWIAGYSFGWVSGSIAARGSSHRE